MTGCPTGLIKFYFLVYVVSGDGRKGSGLIFKRIIHINKLSCLERNASHNDPVFFATKSIDLHVSSIVFKNSVYSLIRNLEIYLIPKPKILSQSRLGTSFEILDLKSQHAVCITISLIQTLKKLMKNTVLFEKHFQVSTIKKIMHFTCILIDRIL